jgi:hypothetical protein
VFNDVYHLAYVPNGGSTQVGVLLYDMRREKIIGEDLYASPITAEQYITVNDAGTIKLYAFGSNLKIYRVEKPALTTDLGSNIAIKITPPMLHSGNCMIGKNYFSESLFVGRTGVIADDMASTTLTTTYTQYPELLGDTGTINMDVSTGTSWQVDTGTGGRTNVGVSGYQVKLQVTGNCPGGKKFYHLSAEVSPAGEGNS